MNKEYPKHFSHNYEFDVSKAPTKKTDRIGLHILLPGIALGLLLIVIGLYELLIGFGGASTAFEGLKGSSDYDSAILSPMVFDVVIVLIGLWIVAALILSYVRYKKVFFDGNIFIITHRPVWGKKTVITEKLENYEGVRFRIEFFQFGLVNKNKYIIELLHKDKEKIVPLYISTKDKHLNAKIKFFAESLGMPIIVTRGGNYVCRTVTAFSTGLADMPAKVEGYSVKDKKYKPKMLVLVEKGSKKVIKVRRVIWDAYNVLSLFAILILGAVLFVMIKYIREYNAVIIFTYVFAVFGILAVVYALFRRDKIIAKPEKIIVHHKFAGFSRKYSEMQKKDINSIEVTTNPATGRNYLVIGSGDENMIFGKKVPVDDLEWARDFLIKEVQDVKLKKSSAKKK